MSIRTLWRALVASTVGDELQRAVRRGKRLTHPRVLLYWNRGLGDIALGLDALIQELRSQLPSANLTVLTRPDLAEAFQLVEVNALLICEQLRRGDSTGFELACRELSVRTSEYDLVFDKPDPTRWLKSKLGVHTPRLGWRPEWDHLSDKFKGISDDKPIICAHVSSETASFYGYVKDWPLEKWASLFDRVAETASVQWVLFGLTTDVPMTRPDVLDLRGQTSLLELLAIIRHRANMLIAVDSGILAMAYYLNYQFPLEVLSLWSDPKQGILKQAVPSPNKLLRHRALVGDDDDVRNITPEQVHAVLTQTLSGWRHGSQS